MQVSAVNLLIIDKITLRMIWLRHTLVLWYLIHLLGAHDSLLRDLLRQMLLLVAYLLLRMRMGMRLLHPYLRLHWPHVLLLPRAILLAISWCYNIHSNCTSGRILSWLDHVGLRVKVVIVVKVLVLVLVLVLMLALLVLLVM